MATRTNKLKLDQITVSPDVQSRYGKLVEAVVEEYAKSLLAGAKLPLELWEEVFQRTPGVCGALQPVQWWVHCGQPAAFIRIEDDRVEFRCGVCSKRRSYRDLD